MAPAAALCRTGGRCCGLETTIPGVPRALPGSGWPHGTLGRVVQRRPPPRAVSREFENSRGGRGGSRENSAPRPAPRAAGERARWVLRGGGQRRGAQRRAAAQHGPRSVAQEPSVSRPGSCGAGGAAVTAVGDAAALTGTYGGKAGWGGGANRERKVEVATTARAFFRLASCVPPHRPVPGAAGAARPPPLAQRGPGGGLRPPGRCLLALM